MSDVYKYAFPSLGLNLQGETSCATSELSLGCGNKVKEEEEDRPTSRSISPGTSSRAVRETDTLTVKVGVLISDGVCLPVVWIYGFPFLVVGVRGGKTCSDPVRKVPGP